MSERIDGLGGDELFARLDALEKASGEDSSVDDMITGAAELAALRSEVEDRIEESGLPAEVKDAALGMADPGTSDRERLDLAFKAIRALLGQIEALREQRDDFYNFLNDLTAEAAYDMPDDTRASIHRFLRSHEAKELM